MSLTIFPPNARFMRSGAAALNPALAALSAVLQIRWQRFVDEIV